jgi:hypothetical protein
MGGGLGLAGPGGVVEHRIALADVDMPARLAEPDLPRTVSHSLLCVVRMALYVEPTPLVAQGRERPVLLEGDVCEFWQRVRACGGSIDVLGGLWNATG